MRSTVFLEVSRYVFFPSLSRLSIRSKFPELLFNALSDYCQLGANTKLLPKIREPVWLYLAQHCSSFQARDCNAAFSQIFEEKTFGTLNADEISLFATQRMFESYCEKCQKNVFLHSRIFLTFVTELGLQKLGYDNNSWPLYVSNIHTQPGKLHCEGCGSLTSEPFNTTVVNSKFLFVEFSPEVRDNVDMHDKIAVGNSLYTLKALVRCYGAHFTCAVYTNGDKWIYFDDLRSTVKEYANWELLRKHNPLGWFFAVFELDENGRIGDIAKLVDEGGKIPQRSKIDRSDVVREQNMADAFIQNGKKCKAQFVKTECEKASAHFHKTSSACASKRKNPVVKQQHGGKGKKTELRARKKHSFDSTCKPQLSNNANNVCTEQNVESSGKRAKKMKPVHSSVQFSVMGAKTCHFMNSVFQQPGVYSCAVDCFLEVSRYVFFPSLSRLSIRSKFPELLFDALSDYCQLGANTKLLPKIREPVWLYLAQHCSSFQARDCNAAFSQIFEEKTFGTLNADEISLFATQRMFESYCEKCQKNVFLHSRIFLTFVTELGLQKLGYDNNSWPLYVSNIHTQPGKLHCEGCGSLTSEPFNTTVVNSKFLFVEFSPEVRDNVDMHDKIAVGNSLYTLKALVRCYGPHFTCAVYMNGGKWMYFDDLRSTVREYANLELLRKHNPLGWFFAVFELDVATKVTKTKLEPEANVVDEVNNQNGRESKVQPKKCEEDGRTSTSFHYHEATNARVSRRPKPVVQKDRAVRNKKLKLKARSMHAKQLDRKVLDQNNRCVGQNMESDHTKNIESHGPWVSLSPNVVTSDEKDNVHLGASLLQDLTGNSGELHEQKSPQEMMKTFHKSMKMCIYQCTVCHEAWPLKSKPKQVDGYICSRCSRDKSKPKKFSAQNSIIPSPIPKELQGLTQFEQMLIARAFPVMHVYTKPRGGQRAYKGHVITLPQDVQQLADVLPRCPGDLPVIIFTVNGKDNCSTDFVVRRNEVSDALHWLTAKNENGESNNPLYKDVKIDEQNLARLPENGVLKNVTRVECREDEIGKHSDDVEIDSGPVDFDDHEKVYNSESEMSSFIPTNIDAKKEEEIITDEFLKPPEKYNWNIGKEPLSEFSCQYLASMAFPTLFPDGKGDPTNDAVLSDASNNATQSFAEKLKHLIKFSEKINGKWVYRFASHPRFAYWAYNILYRKRILGQGNFFLKQNPSEANLTIDDLKEMLQSNSYDCLMSKLTHYAKNVTGTNAYWNRAKDDLKAIITQVGAPTIFWTLSCADFHWPEFHNLLNSNPTTTDSDRRGNVIDNPHLLDWFFTERTEQFVKYWLKSTLGATWYWFRYEYAVQRGSIHCHGVAKLETDPNLCKLSQIALRGHLAAQSAAKHDSTPKMLSQRQEEIMKGHEAERAICSYVDFLMSTKNPSNPDDGNWVKPAVHPCKRTFNDIQKNEWDEDYEDLLNSVQRHTQCSTAYCLRGKKTR